MNTSHLFSLIASYIFALFLPAAVVAMPPPGYALVWQDEFNTLNLHSHNFDQDTVDKTKPKPGWRDHFAHWGVRYLDGNSDLGFKLSDETLAPEGKTIRHHLTQTGRFGDGPFLHGIENGALVMRTYPNPLATSQPQAFDGLPYLASMISGQDLFSQRYGYWEVRFRTVHLPSGHHIALWLLPDTHIWPPEIDLIEIVASEPEMMFANTHGLDAPDISIIDTASNGEALQHQNWHVIGFEWRKDEMIWRLDDQIIRRHAANVDPNIRFYFLASFEIGSNWPGPVALNAKWPGQFEIDYIRIYRR